jgi:hypothetical protein
MPVNDDLGTSQQLSAIATILATGLIRHRRATFAESLAISANSAPASLATAANTVLSVTTRVNTPESSNTNGEAHEH